MKKAFKKAISILLIAVMIFGTAPLAGFIGLDLPEINLFSTKAEAATDGYYSYSVSNGEAKITGADKSISGDVVIPSTLGGYPVTRIGIMTFYGRTSVESIVIPDSVTSIDGIAFAYCSSLKSVTIGKGVTSIEIMAFAFCPNLKSITVDSDNTAFSSDENGILFNKDKTKIIQYPTADTRKSYVISDSVTDIGWGAFAFCKNLENLTIGKGVANIESAAFSGCTNLKSIIIPKSITVIGSDVFPSCDNIRDIYYEGSKADWKKVGIGSNNGTLATAKVHYNYRNSGGSTGSPDNTPAYDSSVLDTYLMPTPTETIISYGDSIILHIDPSKIPEGGKVEWYPSNGNFKHSVSSFGTTCTITPEKSGDTTFTAIVYDADGNIVSADNQEMTSKAGFFDKFVAFFRKLFGATKIIPQAFKSEY